MGPFILAALEMESAEANVRQGEEVTMKSVIAIWFSTYVVVARREMVRRWIRVLFNPPLMHVQSGEAEPFIFQQVDI